MAYICMNRQIYLKYITLVKLACHKETLKYRM